MDYATKIAELIGSIALGNANDETITIYDCLAQGPLIINFYRGAWCPYCNMELRAYREILPQIKALGAKLVAISPELPLPATYVVDKDGQIVLAYVNTDYTKRLEPGETLAALKTI